MKKMQERGGFGVPMCGKIHLPTNSILLSIANKLPPNETYHAPPEKRLRKGSKASLDDALVAQIKRDLKLYPACKVADRYGLTLGRVEKIRDGINYHRVKAAAILK